MTGSRWRQTRAWPAGQRRAALLAVAAWLVVVAGASSATWLVIDHAGREVVLADPVAAVPSPTVIAPPAAPAPASGVSPPTRTPRPGPTPVSPGGRVRPTPAASRPSHQQRAQPPPAAGASTPAVQDSVTVAGGTVGVSCRADSITLRHATPRDGWSFQVQRQQHEIQVHFVRQGGNGESEVHAVCRAGAPVFELS
ncbi:MAG TPA: hypothetical protein VFJ97_02215 [Dermatophilaceae bacterium]|nr:hypothetical protein [Dermatophilaceae bacterium]